MTADPFMQGVRARFALQRTSALQVVCPYCLAQVGVPCDDPQKRPKDTDERPADDIPPPVLLVHQPAHARRLQAAGVA